MPATLSEPDPPLCPKASISERNFVDRCSGPSASPTNWGLPELGKPKSIWFWSGRLRSRYVLTSRSGEVNGLEVSGSWPTFWNARISPSSDLSATDTAWSTPRDSTAYIVAPTPTSPRVVAIATVRVRRCRTERRDNEGATATQLSSGSSVSLLSSLPPPEPSSLSPPPEPSSLWSSSSATSRGSGVTDV